MNYQLLLWIKTKMLTDTFEQYPNKHIEGILDCDDEALCNLKKTVNRISNNLIEKAYIAGGICWVQAMKTRINVYRIFILVQGI